MGVRDEVARNGAPHARPEALQQARGAKTWNRISHRNWLPPEDPAGHRIPQRRIA